MTLRRRLKVALFAAGACAFAASAGAQPKAGADSPSRSLDRQGEAMMREGRLDDALAAFAKALALEPNNARAILLTAQTRWLTSGAQTAFAPVDLNGKPLEAQDFSRLSLSGLNVENVHGPRSDWSHARLEGVSLAGAQLFESDFSGARFLRVNLNGSVLDRARLRDADFTDSTFVRARAKALAAERASLVDARAVMADFEGSNFTGANFAGADLRASRLVDANLADSNFLNADLRGADLSRANLKGASLRGARVDCATRFPEGFNTDAALLTPLDLCGGVYTLDFRNKDLAGMSFRDLDVRGALFAGARLAGVDFTGANLDGADFTGATGFGPKFAPASAREATLENVAEPLAALGGTDLRNALISGPQGQPPETRPALEITLGPSGPRLDGARLRNLRLTLDHRLASKSGGALGLASLLFARIENARIDCAAAPQTRGEPALGEWSAYAETIDAARRAAAANPGVTLGETCRRAAQTYLANNCEAGFRAAGVRYPCPSRP